MDDDNRLTPLQAASIRRDYEEACEEAGALAAFEHFQQVDQQARNELIEQRATAPEVMLPGIDRDIAKLSELLEQKYKVRREGNVWIRDY
jgi:hypothetical protein